MYHLFCGTCGTMVVILAISVWIADKFEGLYNDGQYTTLKKITFNLGKTQVKVL